VTRHPGGGDPALRLHILFEFKEGPWGGGNQFLKALRRVLRDRGAYAENIGDADAVLINSHHLGDADRFLDDLEVFLGKRSPGAILHRIDGPIRLVRGEDDGVDDMVFAINRALADVTIFQSDWSWQRTLLLGLRPQEPCAIVPNAPDPALFHPPAERRPRPRRGIVATSWSANWQKGFDVYRYLDETMDFDRFEMTFLGNSPCHFERIRVLGALPSAEVADELRRNDIYITASRNDPCSNSLIEALHCGLPALYLASGANAEIVRGGGVAFTGTDDVRQGLLRLDERLESYRNAIDAPTLEEIADRYLDLASRAPVRTHRLRGLKARMQFHRAMGRTRRLRRRGLWRRRTSCPDANGATGGTDRL
jgi:glycosyltransferase involved in cell wall biosynthesis